MADNLQNSEYVDNGARATRVTVVDAAGAASSSGTAAVQRVTTVTRFASAGPVGVTAPGTRNITLGKKAYSIAVFTAASTATPTLDGVALPAGTALTFEAPQGDTLEAAILITVAGDDVLLTELA